MTSPFGGLRVIDTTHVLAGPFGAYQLAVLGAEVIKVESPGEPDQARYQGSDRSMNDAGLGTMFLAQASNKRFLSLDLKTADGQAIMKRLARDADVFVENYRPGAFDALGLGYEDLAAINPRLIYCSMSAFGGQGPRAEQTGYDNIIQAMSGLMAMTGTAETAPLRVGAPVIDYATGATTAFAIASALFQRERTGRGQRIDVSMLDVALMLMGAHVTGYGWNGEHPRPSANRYPFATIGSYAAKEGVVMLSAANLRQQRRLWTALDRRDMIKTNNNQRLDDFARECAVLTELMRARGADEWEAFFQARRIPAGRIREMRDALADPQIAARSLLHRHDASSDIDRPLTVPLAAFTFAHGGPAIDRAPRRVGADNDSVLKSVGYSDADLAAFKAAGVI